MKIKQTIIALALVLGIAAVFAPTPTMAATKCGGVQTSILSCKEEGGDKGKCPDGSIVKSDTTCADGSKPDTLAASGVFGILVLVIQILTAGVGVLAVAGIVYGAILYASAGGSAEQVKKARSIITNVVIGLVAYGLMFALLNFIIPGGLIGA